MILITVLTTGKHRCTICGVALQNRADTLQMEMGDREGRPYIMWRLRQNHLTGTLNTSFTLPNDTFAKYNPFGKCPSEMA